MCRKKRELGYSHSSLSEWAKESGRKDTESVFRSV